MRLIDADALVVKLKADAEEMEDPIAKMFTYAAINDVKHAPPVDAVPVVRCRDCASYWSDMDEALNPKLHYCEQHDVFTRKNDFCSYGKRREGDGE